MSIRKAELTDSNIIREITKTTISEVYPHYYPKGAVTFFLEYHCEENIINDIEHNQVFLCIGNEQEVIGTVTIKKNEICRLFVLPQYQRNGYGTEMLDYVESIIAKTYSEICLDASLPAKKIYMRRGYEETEYHTIHAPYNDFLCYDLMVKRVEIQDQQGTNHGI